MIHILAVIGTRPEVVKMGPVIRCLKKDTSQFKVIVCVTGQHREMLDQILPVFGITPDIDLKVMSARQSLSLLTSRLFERFGEVFNEYQPDWVIAQGDTTTVLVAAMSAFYHRIRFGHIEAGLRTGDSQNPFPEEMNRRVVDLFADLCFAPTEKARQILLAEGCRPDKIFLTGNTVVDALDYVSSLPYDWDAGPLSVLPRTRRMVLITAHRRESFGEPIRNIGMAIRRIAEETQKDGVHIVYPVHLNPEIRRPVMKLLTGVSNVTLLDPLPYADLIQLMKRSEMILTDSGGIQEEAPSLKVPVLVMREKTERPEGVDAGVAMVVGTSTSRIVSATITLLRDPGIHRKMVTAKNPYGDGKAAIRIVAALREGVR